MTSRTESEKSREWDVRTSEKKEQNTSLEWMNANCENMHINADDIDQWVFHCTVLHGSLLYFSMIIDWITSKCLSFCAGRHQTHSSLRNTTVSGHPLCLAHGDLAAQWIQVTVVSESVFGWTVNDLLSPLFVHVRAIITAWCAIGQSSASPQPYPCRATPHNDRFVLDSIQAHRRMV